MENGLDTAVRVPEINGCLSIDDSFLDEWLGNFDDKEFEAFEMGSGEYIPGVCWPG